VDACYTILLGVASSLGPAKVLEPAKPFNDGGAKPPAQLRQREVFFLHKGVLLSFKWAWLT
jgi:hypothetical protein